MSILIINKSNGATAGLFVMESGGVYPLRNTVTSDTSSPVIWIGADAPPAGNGYSITGLDIWFKTA